MTNIHLILCICLAGIITSCKKSPSASQADSRPEQHRMEGGKITGEDIKKSDDPITISASRLEVKWQESMPENNSSLVEVVRFIGTGRSYSGMTSKAGDILIIKGLTEAPFEDRPTLVIDVQPPLVLREGEIPEMSLIKIIE